MSTGQVIPFTLQPKEIISADKKGRRNKLKNKGLCKDIYLLHTQSVIQPVITVAALLHGLMVMTIHTTILAPPYKSFLHTFPTQSSIIQAFITARRLLPNGTHRVICTH